MENQNQPVRVQHPNDSTYVEFYGMSVRQLEVLTAYSKLIKFAKKEFEIFKNQKKKK